MEFYYRLSGAAESIAAEYDAEQRRVQQAQSDYLQRNGFSKKVITQSWMSGEELCAVEIPASGLPDGFLAHKKHRGYMKPNGKTKAGRAIVKEWSGLYFSKSKFREKLCKHLLIDEFRFVDGGMAIPTILPTTSGSFLITGSPVEHADLTEITAGDLQKAIDEHNAAVNAG